MALMLVSASDPSSVIKLSEKESTTRSEIWREGHACQRKLLHTGHPPNFEWGKPSFISA